MDEERALYIVRAGEAGAIERVLRDYSDKHRATFRFEPTDEDKRKLSLMETLLQTDATKNTELPLPTA